MAKAGMLKENGYTMKTGQAFFQIQPLLILHHSRDYILWFRICKRFSKTVFAIANICNSHNWYVKDTVPIRLWQLKNRLIFHRTVFGTIRYPRNFFLVIQKLFDSNYEYPRYESLKIL